MSSLACRSALISVLLFLLLQFAPSAYGWSTPASTHPAPMAPGAPTAAQWYDGMSTASSITNCASIIQGMPYQEDGIRTYVGFNADPTVPTPTINQVYFIHVVLWSMGNSCSGQRAYVDISLPDNTSLANDASHPVYCFYDGVAITPASDCPQTLPNSSYNEGWYEIPAPASSSYTWPMPQGHNLEFQIPVKSSTKLTNSLFKAKVWALDGNSSPWLTPQVGVYVFSNDITILYETPSTTGITDVHALSTATVYTYNTVGTAYADIGTDMNYTLFHDSAALATPELGWIITEEWLSSGGTTVLQPDTLYHWRVRYVTGGQTYYGADQAFRTLPSGTVIVGNGQASSCTQAALASQLALGTAKHVEFDCGTLPMTITLSSPLAVSSDVTIDGGNKVTLDGNLNSPHVQLQAGRHLTLTQISLVNGSQVGGCGGSIIVPGGAWLTLDGARFLNNQAFSTFGSGATGGAVCVQANGRADVQYTLFANNHAPTGGGVANYGTTTVAHSTFMTNTVTAFGGAIGNYAQFLLSDSKFSGNTAGINGGAIDTTVAMTVSQSTFNSNIAGIRGGAINNYLGTLTLTGSSLIGNQSNGYGGGLVNDGGTTTVQASTLSGNTAKAVGGGIRNSGHLNITNSTLSGNSATNDGGALEIVDDSALDVSLLNSTLANNTAGGQGGNIHRGTAPGAKIKLKNTLMAFGSPNNCDSSMTSQGNNLESANTCGMVAGGDKTNADPKLGPLQNNGGSTSTRALLSGSPAIDAGTNVGCPATDQRGVARPRGSACDIGAYEAQSGYRTYLPLLRR